MGRLAHSFPISSVDSLPTAYPLKAANLEGSVLGSQYRGSCWDTNLHTQPGNAGISEQITEVECAHQPPCL